MNAKRLYKFLLPTIAIAIASGSASASFPTGYYDSLDGKCGAQLVLAIRNLLANHTEISYSNGTWDAFHDTDVIRVDGTDYWWDMYSDNLVAVSSGHPGLNVEHSVANSWWGGTKNAAYKDLVHLNPSNSDANSRKSNYPLAELASVSWTNGVTSVGTPKSGQGGGNNWAYEPDDRYKGDFARVFMYMFTVYGDISWKSTTNWMYNIGTDLMFKPWAVELLMRWHASDPVSDKERSRNDGIMLHQKNRNPFIDLPDLADHIWGAKATQPFYVDGSSQGNDPDTPTPPAPSSSTEYSWLDATSTTISDGWTYENVNLPETASYIWSWKDFNGSYYLNASAYISGTPYQSEAYAWSPIVSLEDCEKATLSFEHAAKFQTTLQSLCKLAVRDVNSNEISFVEIPKWPTAGSWNFVASTPIDLSGFTGRKVQVGLRYASSASGADTWEIRNMKLTTTLTSGINTPGAFEEDADIDDSCMVEVWGRNIIAPEGARIFSLQGCMVDGRDLQPGIYIVAKPGFSRSVKVLIK